MTRVGAMGMAAGGAMSGAFGAAVSTFNSVGDALAKASDRTGVSVESLSELGYAASQSGSSMAALEKGIRGMSRNVLDAGRGLATAVDNFDDLGVTLADLEGKTPEEQFLLLAGKISDIEDPTRRAALAMKVFGKSGVELLPMLANGVAGVDALRERARSLGLVMSGPDAQAAVTLGDLFADLWQQLRRVSEIVGASLAKHLTAMADVMTRLAASGLAWLDANRGLIASVAAAGVVIAAAGAAFVGLGLSFTLIGVSIGGFLSAISAIGAILSAIVSPIGLLVGGLAALATWFATSTEHGRAMVANLGAWFGQLASTAKRAFGGITAALGMGEIGLAGEVAMASLHVAWLEGTEKLHNAWLDFKDLFMKTTISLVHDAVAELAKIAAKVKEVWTDATTISAQLGERIGHALTRDTSPGQREHSDAASEHAVEGYAAEGERKKTGIATTLQGQLDAIEENRKTAQETQDQVHKDNKRAAEANRTAAEKRLKAAEREVEQRQRQVAREKAKAVDPVVPPKLQAAITAGASAAANNPGGLFDTRHARQMLVGPQDQQIQLLGEIAKNTRRNNNGWIIIT